MTFGRRQPASAVVENLSHLVAIPVAAGVLAPWGIDLPMAAGAVAMSLSTILVAVNAAPPAFEVSRGQPRHPDTGSRARPSLKLQDTPGGYTICLMVSRRSRTLKVLNDAFVPDERKAEVRKRLARLKGQVEGIERMLDQNRPCVEILTQISAAQEALRGAGRVMVRNYLERCASAGIRAGREREVYDEVMNVIFKLTR